MATKAELQVWLALERMNSTELRAHLDAMRGLLAESHKQFDRVAATCEKAQQIAKWYEEDARCARRMLGLPWPEIWQRQVH